MTYTESRRHPSGLDVVVREWCERFSLVSKSFPSRFQLSFRYLSVDQSVHMPGDDGKQLKQAFVGFSDVSSINAHLVGVVSVRVSP